MLNPVCRRIPPTGRLHYVMLSPTRPQRYSLDMQVTYRQAGTDAWYEGRTIDISHSGVLLTAPLALLATDATVELSLKLSDLGPRVADVTCVGRVVRSLVSSGSGPIMAVVFDGYRLRRPPDSRPPAAD